MKLRASRIGTQRNFALSGCHQGKDPPERGVARTASRHPKIQGGEHFSRERAPALPLDASSRSISAENNRAEREPRPLVIARKISFGSQSEQGLKRREVFASVLHTLNKQTGKPICHFLFTRALDVLNDQPNAKSLSTVVQFFLTRSNPAVTDALRGSGAYGHGVFGPIWRSSLRMTAVRATSLAGLPPSAGVGKNCPVGRFGLAR